VTPGSRGPQAALLLIVGEPVSVEQKDLIFERIVTELSAWDQAEAGCDIDEILGKLDITQATANIGPNGEKFFHHEHSETVVDVLINPRLSTLRKHVGPFLVSSAAKYRHLVYAGLAFVGSGAWLAQDGLFTFAHLVSTVASVREHAKVSSGTSDNHRQVLAISPFAEGEWTEANIRKVVLGPGGTKEFVLKLNPGVGKRAELEAAEEGIIKFADSLSTTLAAPATEDLLTATSVVGAVSFTRPTLYVFPAGDGCAALFAINGFSLLVDGGYQRRACFWDFVKHLNRLDAILSTHVSGDNVLGLGAFIERKAVATMSSEGTEGIHPEVGVVFMNVSGTGGSNSALSRVPVNGSAHLIPGGGLLVSLGDEGCNITGNLQRLGLVPQPVYATVEPISLYHKIGHGSLDLFVLSPQRDSREVKDFLSNWTKALDNYSNGNHTCDTLSIACVLVWRPASKNERITRLMFTGSAPQAKIFEGLDRLKSVPVFQATTGVPAASEIKKAPAVVEKDKAEMTGSAAGRKASSARGVTASLNATKPAPSEKKSVAANAAAPGVKAAEKSEGSSKHEATTGRRSIVTSRDVSVAAAREVSSTSMKAGKKPEALHQTAARPDAKKADVKSDSKVTNTAGNTSTVLDSKSTAKPPTNKTTATTLKAKDVKNLKIKKTDETNADQAKKNGAASKPTDNRVVRKSTTSSAATKAPALSATGADMKQTKQENSLTTGSSAEVNVATSDPSDIDIGATGDAVGEASEKEAVSESSSDCVHQVTDENCGASADDSPNLINVDDQIHEHESERDSLNGHLSTATHDEPHSQDYHHEGNGQDGPAEDDSTEEEQIPTDENGATSSEQAVIDDGNLLGLDSNVDSNENGDIENNNMHIQFDTDHNANTEAVDVHGIDDNGNDHNDDDVENVHSAGDHAEPENNPEFDPVHVWDPPSSLPAPLGDEAAGGIVMLSGNNAADKTGETTAAADTPATAVSESISGKVKSGKVLEKITKPSASTNVTKRQSVAPNEPGLDISSAKSKKSLGTLPSAIKKPQGPPFYVDLVYVPRRGADAEFFRRVHSSTYVVSSAEHDVRLLDVIVDAVRTRREAPGELHTVRILPTHDTDELMAWKASRTELEALNVEVLTSAERCTIHLQEQDSSCRAFRLEF